MVYYIIWMLKYKGINFEVNMYAYQLSKMMHEKDAIFANFMFT